ncbi:MAG: GTP cyclohydrolase I FolE2 [Candidatus Brocadiae bacterium]|nr:GTP cyclohydrolase I FolE2 [Candidatus Brocadiia bacterium]
MKNNTQKIGQHKEHLQDIQNSEDQRGLEIDKVGVCDLCYPITVLDRQKEKQHTIAQITMSVNLPHNFKGTHMSRFISVLNQHRGEITMRTLPTVLEELKLKLKAESAHIEVSFPYMIEKTAPISHEKGLMYYDCRFAAESNSKTKDFILNVAVPITSLCPCSKAISDYGAHNQRGIIEISIRTYSDNTENYRLVWIEELIELAEQSASSPVYPILKRTDERHVTMQAYDNPMFVEDIVRNVAMRLNIDPRISWFSVRVVNQESIHNHSAFAQIERKK